jgi:hypothetical protein
MFLILAALVVGYAVGGATGSAVGGAITLALAALTYFSTPPEQRVSPHDAQMQSNQAYREAHSKDEPQAARAWNVGLGGFLPAATSAIAQTARQSQTAALVRRGFAIDEATTPEAAPLTEAASPRQSDERVSPAREVSARAPRSLPTADRSSQRKERRASRPKREGTPRPRRSTSTQA